MEQVDLAQAALSEKKYYKGMFVDFGVQFPLGSGYGCPVIDFYAVTKDNPTRIKKIKVFEEGSPPSYEFKMIYDQWGMHSIRVTFDKNEEVNIGNLLFQKDFPDKISLQQAQSRRAYLTHAMWGGPGNVSEPELIEDVVAYIGQSNCCGSEDVGENLLYFEEATKENVGKAIEAIMQKHPDLIQMSDGDISVIVDAVFEEKVMSAHEGHKIVDNEVFVNVA